MHFQLLIYLLHIHIQPRRVLSQLHYILMVCLELVDFHKNFLFGLLYKRYKLSESIPWNFSIRLEILVEWYVAIFQAACLTQDRLEFSSTHSPNKSLIVCEIEKI